jgi:hypothetical protein
VPSETPSIPPSSMPTAACIIELNSNCTIANGTSAGEACDNSPFFIEPCLARPTAATMLYNGGTCDQSDNRQLLKFTCEDQNGGPPTQEGAQSHIIVTDIKGNGIVYFDGLVGVGENFRLNDDNQRFQADMLITISSTDQSTVLQIVQYHSSCSSNLELKNRFGASQPIQFFNDVQGNVTCFGTLSFDLDIQVPFTIVGGSSITLETMTTVTNFAGIIDLTDQVQGTTVFPGDIVTVTLTATIDASERRRYTLLTTITGTANPGGNTCIGTEFESFFAGSPKAPIFPTIMPTRAPTVSPAPTPDPLNAECIINAGIFCEALFEGRQLYDCDNIPNPLDVECSDGNAINGLTFIYRGTKCPVVQNGFECRDRVDAPLPESVFVFVEAKELTTSVVVPLGGSFSAFGEFDEAVITISFVENGVAGEDIQEITIDTSCEDASVINLGQRYGAIELTGFVNARGTFSSVYDIKLSYVVQNGPFVTIVDSAFINSIFQVDPFNAITGPQTVRRGALD